MSLTPFENAVSGSLGALFANSLVFPLDVIKTRIQVQPIKKSKDSNNDHHYDDVFDAFWKILKNEGIWGLYSGLGTGLSGTVIQNFAYFYAYGVIRGGYVKRIKPDQEISTPMELFLGGLSGAVTQLFTLPIAVIATRQQTTLTKNKLTFYETLTSIINEDGVTGLWRGLRASLVLCINPAITYGAFERLKSAISARKVDPSVGLSSFEAFLLGALSKTLATIVTYPYIMAKVRLQYKPPTSLSNHDKARLSYKGALDVLGRVLKENGIFGWYRGMSTQITKAVLCQAILFSLKEQENIAASVFNSFTDQNKSQSIPPNFVVAAMGVAIVKGTKGTAVVRLSTGEWSAPCAFALFSSQTDISPIQETVILFMTESSIINLVRNSSVVLNQTHSFLPGSLNQNAILEPCDMYVYVRYNAKFTEPDLVMQGMTGWQIGEDGARHNKWHGKGVSWFDVLTNKITVDRSSVGNALYLVLNLVAGRAVRPSNIKNFVASDKMIGPNAAAQVVVSQQPQTQTPQNFQQQPLQGNQQQQGGYGYPQKQQQQQPQQNNSARLDQLYMMNTMNNQQILQNQIQVTANQQQQQQHQPGLNSGQYGQQQMGVTQYQQQQQQQPAVSTFQQQQPVVANSGQYGHQQMGGNQYQQHQQPAASSGGGNQFGHGQGFSIGAGGGQLYSGGGQQSTGVYGGGGQMGQQQGGMGYQMGGAQHQGGMGYQMGGAQQQMGGYGVGQEQYNQKAAGLQQQLLQAQQSQDYSGYNSQQGGNYNNNVNNNNPYLPMS